MRLDDGRVSSSSIQRYFEADSKIRTAFIELLAQYDFNDITASMIIGKAHINRSTFYAHFQDKYALFDAIEDEIIDNFDSISLASPVSLTRYGVAHEESLRAHYASLVNYLSSYGHVLVALLDRNDRVIVESVRSLVEDIISQAQSFTSLRMPIDIVAGGAEGLFFGMVRAWVKGGCKEEDAFVEILVEASDRIFALFFESDD